MKITKILSTALSLAVMSIGLTKQADAQTSEFGGTAYVYAEDRQGNEVVLNAAVEYVHTTESSAKSALLKKLKFGGYEFTSEVRYATERWNSKRTYAGFASATIVDRNGKRKEIRTTVDCDAVGMGYISYFKSALKDRLDEQVDYYSNYITPITYRVQVCN